MMRKLTPLLVFTAIAAAFFYGLGIQGLQEQEHRSKWPKHKAKIIKSEIISAHHQEGSAHYGLHLTMKINIGGQTRILKRQKSSGTLNSIKKLKKRDYKVGNEIPIYINPENKSEILFEVHHSWGPYLVGFFPALVFFLIALSTLKTKATTRPEESERT